MTTRFSVLGPSRVRRRLRLSSGVRFFLGEVNTRFSVLGPRRVQPGLRPLRGDHQVLSPGASASETGRAATMDGWRGLRADVVVLVQGVFGNANIVLAERMWQLTSRAGGNIALAEVQWQLTPLACGHFALA